MKRQKEIPGSIVKIQIDDEFHIYGRVLNYGDTAFYDCKTNQDIDDLAAIIKSPIMFKAIVNYNGVVYGRWTIIGLLPLEDDLINSKYWLPEVAHPELCKISENGVYRWMVDRSEAEGLFDGAIWAPELIEQRIKDFYAGVPNEHIERIKSMK